MYDQTINLYCLNGGTWRKATISGVDVGVAKATGPTTQGERNADGVILLVNCAADKSIITRDNRTLRYLERKAYAASAAPASAYTFTEPSFFIVGDTTLPDTAVDDDYDEGFYSYVNAYYDHVYRVTSASWYGLLPHFEVGGA